MKLGKKRKGLANLGNTCFMNSILQCLVHMPCLQQYFLTETHQLELNKRSIHGTRGKLALAFG